PIANIAFSRYLPAHLEMTPEGAVRRTPSRPPRCACGKRHPGAIMFVQLTRDYLGRKAGERIDLSEADAAPLLSSGAAEAVRDDLLTPMIHRALDSALS